MNESKIDPGGETGETLTAKQGRFVGDYLIDHSASHAAIECADRVLAEIKQEAIGLEQLFESIRSGARTLEGLLDEIDRGS
jgi:hypothetical protein